MIQLKEDLQNASKQIHNSNISLNLIIAKLESFEDKSLSEEIDLISDTIQNQEMMIDLIIKRVEKNS